MEDEGGDSEPSCEPVDNSVSIHVRRVNGTTFNVRTSLELTVVAFKGLVTEKCDVPADQQRLIYKGRILKDDRTLETYGLQADHTVHMVQVVSPSWYSPTRPVISAGSGNTTTRSNRGTGSNETDPPLGGFVSPLLPDLAQQHPNQSPNTTTELMNIPAFENMLNDPELVRTWFLIHPRMRNIMDQDPELERILNDPEIHRRIVEAARNPELMRGTIPDTGWFNSLRRIYESYLELVRNAATLSGNSNSDLNSNPFVALLRDQGATQPSGASNNPTTTASEIPNVPNTNPLPNPSNTAEGIQPNVGERGTIPTRGEGIGGLGGPGAIDSVQKHMADTILRNMISARTRHMRSRQRNTSRLNELQSIQNSAAAGGTTGTRNTCARRLKMSGGRGAGSLSVPNQPDEEVYATQLSQLQEMGFFDTEENIRALRTTWGNVHAAIEQLLRNHGL